MEMKNTYWRFAAMIGTSTLVMLGLMYLNTYAFEHVRWSETRFYMAFLMGGAMAVIMLSFMLNMYKNQKINVSRTYIALQIVYSILPIKWDLSKMGFLWFGGLLFIPGKMGIQ